MCYAELRRPEPDVSSRRMEHEPLPPRGSITRWIAMVAVGAALFVVALAPGVPKQLLFVASAVLLVVGVAGIGWTIRRSDR